MVAAISNTSIFYHGEESEASRKGTPPPSGGPFLIEDSCWNLDTRGCHIQDDDWTVNKHGLFGQLSYYSDV